MAQWGTERPSPTRPRSSPVLLLPGTLCDERVFAPVRGAFGDRATVAFPLPDERDVEAMARRVLDRVPGRFAIVGLSLGGIVALHVALLAPHRVAGLALIAANARSVPADQREHRRQRSAAALGDLEAYAHDELAPLYAGPAAAADPSYARLVAEMAVATGARALDAQTAAALTRVDLRPRLSLIQVPVAIIGGSEDRLGTPDMQRELAQGLPDAELTVLTGVGHLAPLENSPAVSTALASWLVRVDRADEAAYEHEQEERV